MFKVVDPMTGMTVECETAAAVRDLLDVLVARKSGRPAVHAPMVGLNLHAPPLWANSEEFAAHRARVEFTKPSTDARRSIDQRRLMALALLRKVRDGGSRGSSGRELAAMLKVPARGLAGQRTFLESVAKEMGLDSADALVKKGRRTPDGSEWLPGSKIAHGIEYLERKTGQVAANGTH